MVSGQAVKIAAILGLALYITYVLTALGLGFIMPFVPLGLLGPFAGLISIIITILAMGTVGGVVLRFVR